MLRLIKTNIDKCYKIITVPKKDNRGYFLRSFCSDELKKLKFNIKQQFRLIKMLELRLSLSKIAFQRRCANFLHQGEIFNVIYDLRSNSKLLKNCLL